MLSLVKKILKPAGTGRSSCSAQTLVQTALGEMAPWEQPAPAAWSPRLQAVAICCASAAVGQLKSGLLGHDLFFVFFSRERKAGMPGHCGWAEGHSGCAQCHHRVAPEGAGRDRDAVLLSQGTLPIPSRTSAPTVAQLVLVLLKVSTGLANKEIVLVGFWIWCLDPPVSSISM